MCRFGSVSVSIIPIITPYEQDQEITRSSRVSEEWYRKQEQAWSAPQGARSVTRGHTRADLDVPCLHPLSFLCTTLARLRQKL